MRSAARSLARSSKQITSRGVHRPTQYATLLRPQTLQSRCFSVTIVPRAGLMPETDEPQPPKEVGSDPIPAQATEISNDEYHDLSEDYLNAVYEKAEALAESREDVEVDYSAGVLTISCPPNGTYVINKQPPNKQIWLSSPVSGPKRYDYVLAGEGQNEKEGGGTGEWIYLRDGTNMTELLMKELGLVVDAHDAEMKQSVDPTE